MTEPLARLVGTALCAYEGVALITRRVPTISSLVLVRRPLERAIIAGVAGAVVFYHLTRSRA